MAQVLTYARCFPDINGEINLSLGHVDIPSAGAIIVVGHPRRGCISGAIILWFNGSAKVVENSSTVSASQLERCLDGQADE